MVHTLRPTVRGFSWEWIYEGYAHMSLLVGVSFYVILPLGVAKEKARFRASSIVSRLDYCTVK